MEIEEREKRLTSDRVLKKDRNPCACLESSNSFKKKKTRYKPESVSNNKEIEQTN